MLLASALAAGAVPRYTVTWLWSGTPYDINNRGQVVGVKYDPSNRAVLYDHGTMVDLGPGAATSINNLGQLVVHRFPGNPDLYQDGGVNGVQLPAALEGYDARINDLGDIVAGSALYRGGVVTTVNAPQSHEPLFLSLNNKGHLLGFGLQNGGLYLGALGNLQGIGFVGEAFNDNDEIAGYAPDGTAAVYNDGVVTKLGFSWPGMSPPKAINNAGQIIDQGAWLYTDGQLVDVNTLIDPAYTIWNLIAINDSGQLVADGPGGAYLLTPVPDPSGLPLAGMLLAMLLMRWR